MNCVATKMCCFSRRPLHRGLRVAWAWMVALEDDLPGHIQVHIHVVSGTDGHYRTDTMIPLLEL